MASTTYTQVVPSGGDAQELLAKIQRTHLSYLQLDDYSQKLKLRWELEALISTHLSTVPHKEKFPCQRFLEILRRSIEDKSDFSASSASKAFNILERYAENLISQPWRMEFRCLKLYNGFYKHQVESQLSCTEEVFSMMGYEDGEFMEMNLDGPVDPDRVIDVSLNCFIALVECKLMNEIMEKLSEGDWQDIASLRRHNVCGVAKAAQLLSRANMKRNRMYPYVEERSKTLPDSWTNSTKNNSRYVKVEKLVDAPSFGNDSGLLLDERTRYPPTFYASKWEEKQPSVAAAASNGHHAYDSDYFIPKTIDEHINLQNLFLNDDCYRQSKYTPGAPQVGPRNDSWGYIERMHAAPWSIYNNYGDVSKRKLDEHLHFPNQSYALSRSGSSSSKASPIDIHRSLLCKRSFPPKSASDQHYFSPEPPPPSYLYPSRPVDHLYRTYHAPTVVPVNYEVLPKPVFIQQKGGEEMCDLRMKTTRGDESNRRSWYDNVDSSGAECESQQNRRLMNNGDVLPPPTQFQNEPEALTTCSVINTATTATPTKVEERNAAVLGHRRWPSDGAAAVGNRSTDASKFISSPSFDGKMTAVVGLSSKEDAAPKKRVEAALRPSLTWSCHSCTYLNPAGSRICEMCSRSRRPGAESDPLSSGGHECQKCTLVNEKGAPKCLACGHSLENSPTYV